MTDETRDDAAPESAPTPKGRTRRASAPPPEPAVVRFQLVNVEIAGAFEELADLMDIQGENPFRVRAWRNAAQALHALTRPVCEMVAAGEDPRVLPGIGKEIAAALCEMLAIGRLSRLDEIDKVTPRSLVTLMRVEGLGPKRAKLLFQNLGVRDVDGLRQALEAGAVEALPGFGAASARKLRESLARVEARPNRIKRSDAEQVIEPLLRALRELPGVEAVETAGSMRRRAETIGDADILVAAEDSGPVVRAFTTFPGVVRVLGAGPTKASVVLASGLQVDLRCLPRRSFGAALQYFTGSKAHGVAVRRIAVEKGLRLNEYGLFRLGAGASEEDPGELVAGEREEDVYAALGLPWIPPELREDRGEVEAALAGRLPRLIEQSDIRGDLQLQSTFTDGHDSLEALVRECRDMGYEYVAITDHSKAVTVARGMDADGFRRQWEEIDRVRREVPGIVLLRGAEVDILPDGSLDLPDDCLAELDVVLASVHGHRDMPLAQMTDRVLRAMHHPAVTILAHPTGRKILRREPLALDVDAVLRAAVELDVAVEVNGQPDRLDLNDVHLLRARELGVRLVLSTDAHAVSHLRNMRLAVYQARRGWVEKDRVANTLPWPEFSAWLRRKGKTLSV